MVPLSAECKSNSSLKEANRLSKMTKWVWVVAGSQRHMGGKHGLTEGDMEV